MTHVAVSDLVCTVCGCFRTMKLGLYGLSFCDKQKDPMNWLLHFDGSYGILNYNESISMEIVLRSKHCRG